MDVKELLTRVREVTRKHIEKRIGGAWSLSDQLNHIHSEVSETYDTLRRPHRYENAAEHTLEELIDVIYSSLTAIHIHGLFTDREIELKLEEILERIERRVQ